MENVMKLSELAQNGIGRVTALTATGAMRERLLDIGLVPGAEVRCVGQSPGGDPAAYLICGAVIAIRRRDAATVVLEGREDDDG